MQIYARQGDLVIEKIEIPSNADTIQQTRVVFAGDSSGHRHVLSGKMLVLASGAPAGTTRIRIDVPLKLLHEKPDGHESVALVAGDYEIRPLRERGAGLDRSVED